MTRSSSTLWDLEPLQDLPPPHPWTPTSCHRPRGDLPDTPEQETKLPTLEVVMSELDDFLTPTLARQVEAEKALINGDPGPRLAMWSTQEPVTVFGAIKSDIGSEEVRRVFRWLATRFSSCTDYRFELVAAGASGELAYTLGYEHFSSPWTAARSSRLPCASPTSTAARTASGRSSTAMPTPPRSIRPLPPRRRRSRR
jgi:hypothetical protein